MENNLTNELEKSDNELLQLIRHHVEDILHKHAEQSGIILDYDVRNEAVYFTYEKIIKKWVNDSRFEKQKDGFIRYIAKNHLFTK